MPRLLPLVVSRGWFMWVIEADGPLTAPACAVGSILKLLRSLDKCTGAVCTLVLVSTRFVGKPGGGGVTNVFLTYIDYFFGGGGQYKLGG